MRMRHRRAQRCLLRAEIALEAGFADDAREALEEARRLGAAPETVAKIEAQIAASSVLPSTGPLEVPPSTGPLEDDVAGLVDVRTADVLELASPVEDIAGDAQIAASIPAAVVARAETDAPPRLSWAFILMAMLVMALAAALAGVVVLRQPPHFFYSSTPADPAPQLLANPEPPPQPTPGVTDAVQNLPVASTDSRVLGTTGADPIATGTAEAATAAENVADAGPGEPAPAEQIVVQRETVPIRMMQSSAVSETTSALERRPAPSPVAPAASSPSASPPLGSLAPTSPASRDELAPRAAATNAPAVVNAPAIERVNVDPVRDLTVALPPAPPPVSLPVNTAASADVPPPSTAPPSAPLRDESADVRAVLARYESAYTQLDPSQARAVWPGVDERALSRAFNSLAAQRVSLGRCDVTLNGATARATCAGTATWTPKVGGGGARTEARRWTFELAKSGDGWKIAKAVVR